MTTDTDWKPALTHLYGTLAVCGLAFCGTALLAGLVLTAAELTGVGVVAFVAAGTSVPVIGVLAYAARTLGP